MIHLLTVTQTVNTLSLPKIESAPRTSLSSTRMDEPLQRVVDTRVVASNDMSGPGPRQAQALFDLLDTTRRRLRRAVVIEALVLIGAGVTGALVLAAFLCRLEVAPAILATIQLTCALGFVGYALIRYGLLIRRSIRSQDAVARWLDDAIEQPASVGFRSAVELARDRGAYGESEVLTDAAIANASGRTRTVDVAKLVKSKAAPTLRRKLIAFGTFTFALFILLAAMPEHVLGAIGALATVGQIDEALSPPPPEPRLDDIRLTYRAPSYARRPTRTVNSSSGEIRALPGTEVTIETRAQESFASATLIVSHGDGTDEDGSRINVDVDGRELRTTLIISRGGRYRFATRTFDGDVLEERRGHEIDLELDAPPEVEMTKPDESPLEVNEGERVEIAFKAEDDFGLQDAFIAWRVLGTTREGRQPLTTGTRGRRAFKGTGQLDLSKLDLGPGDHVAYSVEVQDNDTVNGPKFGASVTQELRIYSKEAHHREVMAMQQKALDELIHVLGDNLEGPFDFLEDSTKYAALLTASDKVVQRAVATGELLRETVRAIADDPLGRKEIATAFDSARRDLVKHNRRGRRALNEAKRAFKRLDRADRSKTRHGKRVQDRMVGSLEKNVVYLADLLNDQRMIDAEALTEQLREQQQALREAIKDYKNAPDDQKRQLLMKAIQDIKNRISEITKELSKLQGSIPQDYVNPDALETKDTTEGMERVQKMIEDGDLDGAMEELERMLADTERMLSQMQEGREELGSREYSEVTEKAKELWKDLEKVEEQQRELARKTEGRAQEMLERMKERLGDADKFVKKQLARLDEVKKSLEGVEDGARVSEGDPFDQTMRRIDDTKRALEAKDFGAAKEMAEQGSRLMGQLQRDTRRRADQARRFGDFMGNAERAEDAAREIDRTKPKLDDVLEDIEDLMPDPSKLLSEAEQRQLDQFGKQQAGLQKQTQQLEKKLGELGQELPIVGQGMPKMLQEAQGAMQQSGQGLGQGDAPGSLGEQRRALDALNRFRDALQQMGGQEGGGSGVPLPFSPSGGNPQRGGQGRDPRSMDKVEIPKADQYRAPAEFREEILDAAKQGTVESYREAVRRYYEEIVK